MRGSNQGISYHSSSHDRCELVLRGNRGLGEAKGSEPTESALNELPRSKGSSLELCGPIRVRINLGAGMVRAERRHSHSTE